MPEEEKNSKKDLRKFGITMGSAFAILGIFFWWRDKDFSLYFLIVSPVFIVFGLALPNVLKPVQKAWLTFSKILGRFMTGLILTILFYAVVTPIGLFLRLMGKDPLAIKSSPAVESYWVFKKEKTVNREDYEKQY